MIHDIMTVEVLFTRQNTLLPNAKWAVSKSREDVRHTSSHDIVENMGFMGHFLNLLDIMGHFLKI